MSKVLHIDLEGVVVQNDPEVIQVECTCVIMETGQTAITHTVYPAVTLKALGLYKLPAVLNANIQAGVEDYLANAYSITGFNKTYLTGGFVTV